MADAKAVPTETTLRRVVVGFRVLALVWMAILVIATLATDDEANKAWVVASLVAATAATLLTVAFGRERRLLTNRVWLAVDGASALFIAVSPALADSADLYYGGYPLSWLLAILYARSTVAAGAMAVTLLVAAQVATNIGASRTVTATDYAGDIAVWIASGIVYGWAMFALRRADLRRAAAESERDDERIRRRLADERAEIAARLHDSVLQTLAVIHNQTAEEETRHLALRQQRELRRLIDEMASQYEASFRAELRAAAADVEEQYRITVDAVVVGDCELDDRLEAMTRAAREALVNAALHSGDDKVSLFAEVDQDVVRVLVRDRGVGFDPGDVDPGHHGVSTSVVGRMERYGGTAMIRSSPGMGTEVELIIRRAAPAAGPPQHG